MKKMSAWALVVLGLPLWWWTYWKLEAKLLPIDATAHLSNAIGDVRPTGSFNSLLLYSEHSNNRRLFKLLTSFSPITVHRPGSEIIVKVLGDVKPIAFMAGSTDDSAGDLHGKAAESHNATLQSLLVRMSTTAVFLKSLPQARRDAPIIVPGDILTRFDWNAQGDQKVRIRNTGRHLTLTYDGLQELIRRKKALIDAGVIEAPPPTREEIEADAREETAFPPHIQLEQETPYSNGPFDQIKLHQDGVFPASSTVGAYEIFKSNRGGICLVNDEATGLTGWIEAPAQGCGLESGPPPEKVQAAVSMPEDWISTSDKRELESRDKAIDEAMANPVHPLVVSTLAACEWYTKPFTALFSLWCLIGLVTNGIRNAGLRKYQALAKTRSGYGIPDYGVPHCRYESTQTGGFRVTLRNNNYNSPVGCLVLMLAVPTLAILYYFFGGASTGFLVLLTLIMAALYFSFYREPSRIELDRASNTITINGARLELDHFHKFHVHEGKQLGYQYGLRNYWLPGNWKELEVMEISAALNAHIAVDIDVAPPGSAIPQQPPKDLRTDRPMEF